MLLQRRCYVEMNVSVDPGNAMTLTVVYANKNFIRAIHPSWGEEVVGRNIRELFTNDEPAIDTWLEHYVIWMNSDIRKPKKHESIQYFQTVKRWMYIQTKYKKLHRIRISFTELNTMQLSNDVLATKQRLLLAETISDSGYWEINKAADTIFMSQNMVKILKLAKAPCIMPLQQVRSIVHPEDLEDALKELTNVCSTRRCLESRCTGGDGSLIHLMSYILADYDEAGQVTKISGLSLDITARRKVEGDLMISERKFRSIVENANDFFLVVNSEGIYTYASPNVLSLFNVAPETFLGRPMGRVLAHPDDQAATHGFLMECLREQTCGRTEVRMIKNDGSILWCQLSFSITSGMSGEDNAAIIVGRDITADKQYYSEIEYRNKHDALTGLHNRMCFEQEIKAIEAQHIVNVSTIYADLNGLKLVNDAFGYEKGNELLCDFADILQSVCRPGDFLARTGGDEFVAILYETDRRNAENLCKAIQKIICQRGEDLMPLSVALGVSYRESPTTDMLGLCRLAESRMNNNKLLESRSMHNRIILSLQEALRERNAETSDHVTRMERTVRLISDKLDLTRDEVNRLTLLASMHDIGKVAIPDHVINKPGGLTAEEWAIMRSHSEIGYRIALASQDLADIANEICSHHERWDGEGYPHRLAGKDIPLLSRVISVLDSYDVMTNERVYKKAMTHSQAIDELLRCSGTQFDPEIVHLFCGCMNIVTYADADSKQPTNNRVTA